MKKYYLTLLSLLFTFFVLAEPTILEFLPIDIPKQKTSKKQKKSQAKNTSTISANKSFTVEGGGEVVPGTQLNYTILLTANSTATGLILRDTLNQNLTLVSGTLEATPVANDDAYSCIGNVGIDVSNVANGVLNNDASPDGKTLAVEAVNNGTTLNNGTFNLNTDGTFTYNPATGFIGNDSFTYTLKNEDNLQANETGKVQITVSQLIYFVDASVSTNGNGTLQAPFKNLTNITGTNSHPIFIYSGDYSGAISLNESQKIIGQGATESLSQILGLNVPSYSLGLPSTGGMRPTISNHTTAITLSSSNALYGLNITTTGGITMTGQNVGDFKVREVSLSNTSGQALQISDGGILDCSFTSISAKAAEKGISVSNTSGSFKIIGIGTNVGTGGTIENTARRGFEFNNVTNINLKNINFVSANTQPGNEPGDKNNAEVNAALYFSNSSNIDLDNIQVNPSIGNANAQMGINLYKCTDFSLTNSKVLRSGLGSGSAAIFAINTKGTVEVHNSVIGQSSRAARFTNESGNLSLNISNSKFIDTRTIHDNNTLNAEGEAALLLEGFGSSTIESTITESEFLRYATQGVAAYANGSSTINVNISKCILNSNNPNLAAGEDTGTGIDFASSENGGTVLFNVLNSKISGRQGHQINVFTKNTSRAEGTIDKDTVVYNYLNLAASNIGSGIRIKHSSNSTNTKILLNDNNISGINSANDFGINVLTNTKSTNGRLDVISTNNVIRTGSNSQYAMRLAAENGSQKLCSKLINNDVNAGQNGIVQFKSGDILFSNNIFLFEGNTTGFTLAEQIQNLWNDNGNLIAATGQTPNIHHVVGNGTFTFGATCMSPTNTFMGNMKLAGQNIEESLKIQELEDFEVSIPANQPTDIHLKPSSKDQKDAFIKVAKNENPHIIVLNGSGEGFTIQEGKSTTIRYSTLVSETPSTCEIPNYAIVSGTNFPEIKSNTSTAFVIIDAPTAISSSKNTVCDGDSLTFDANCILGIPTWYLSATSTTPIGVGRNHSFTPEAGSPRYYYVACESENCKSTRIQTPDLITVKPKPIEPTLTAPSQLEVCFPNTLEIIASACNEGTIVWSDNSTLPSLVLSEVGTYTVSAKCISNGCVSNPGIAVENLKIAELPDPPLVSNQHVCSGNNLSLTATCPTSNSQTKWYLDAAGINEMSPELSNVTSSASYYVACLSTLSTACQSSLVEVKVIVDTLLSFPHNYSYYNSVYACQNGSAEIILDTTLIMGSPYNLQWQILSNGSFSNLEEGLNYNLVNNDTLKLSNLYLALNNSLFRALISNSCNSINADTTSLKINQLPQVIKEPIGQSVCVGNQTTLSVMADGSGLSYQWQVNAGNGFVNLNSTSNYSNVNSPNLLISSIPNSFNNYRYRCVIFNNCQTINSNEAVIQVDPTVTIMGQPISRTVCQEEMVSFTVNTVNINNGTLTYKWQRSINGGITYLDIVEGSTFSGITTKTLIVTNIPASFNKSKFRCIINDYCQSYGAELLVTPIATVTASPTNSEICEGNNTSFSIKANGIGLTYRWQLNKGLGFQNILNGGIYDGATTSTLNLYYPTTEANGYKYRCLVWGTSNCDVIADTSGVAILSVGTSSEAHSVVWNSSISTDNGTTQAVSYIFGNNKILQPNGKATYQAGQAILLEPGFEVQAGAVFEAKIKNACLSTNNIKGMPDKIKK